MKQNKLINPFELKVEHLTNEGATRTYASHDLIQMMDSKYSTFAWSNVSKELVEAIVAYLFKSTNSYTDEALFNMLVEMFHFTFKEQLDADYYAAHLFNLKQTTLKGLER